MDPNSAAKPQEGCRITQLTKDHAQLASDYGNLYSQHSQLQEEINTLKSSLLPNIQTEIAKATQNLPGARAPPGPAPKKRGNRNRW